jgi:serine/threonine protein kinase
MTAGDDRVVDSETEVDGIIADFLEAVDSGQRVDRQEWLRRHPHAADALAEFFTDQDGFAGRLAPLKQCLGGEEGVDDLVLPEVGTLVGNYELLEEIARGGMGVVFKARQINLNRLVALKMILRGASSSGAEQERFRQEAEAVARLDHPHIIPIYDIDTWENQPYFSMRFIEGGSLAQWIVAFKGRMVDGKPSFVATAKFMTKVGRAVHFAHQRGILHRDLKPGNILLQPDPATPGDLGHAVPFVADFGLAKCQERATPAADCSRPRATPAMPSLTQTGTAVGTPSYMAPEQVPGASGTQVQTTASDVYSLGAVIYELISGEPPFRAATVTETLQNVVTQPAKPPRRLNDRIPADLEAICLKCLEKDPARRYDSAESLAADLERFSQGRPIEARPIGRIRRVWRWSRQQPALAAACAVAILGLVSAAVLSGLFAYSESQGRAALEKAAGELELALKEQSKLARERQDALLDAQTQRLLAEQNHRKAHQAAEDFYVRFSASVLSKLPGQQPAQKEMLTSALKYFQEFLELKGDDPALRLDLARTCVRIANINSLMGLHDEAFAYYARAIAGADELLREDVSHREARRWKAAACQNRAVLLVTMDRHREALQSDSTAAGLYRALVQDGPNDLEVRQHLAALLSNMGDLYRSMRQFDRAQECLQEARTTLEPLLEKDSRHAPYKEIEGTILVNLGVVHQALGKKDESLACFQQAGAIYDDLAKRFRTDQHFLQLYATNLCRIAVPLNNRGRSKEGVPLLEKSKAILDALIRENPSVPSCLVDWAITSRALGNFYRSRKEFARALEIYKEVQLRLQDENAQRIGGAAIHRELAEILYVQAAVYLKQKDAVTALQCVDRSLELRRQKINLELPFQDRQALGAAMALRGEILAEQGKLDDASDAIRAAIVSTGENTDSAPTVPSYIHDLHDEYKLLVKVQKEKDPAAALRSAQQAQDHFTKLVGKHPDVPLLRHTLARILIDHGVDLRQQNQLPESRVRLEKGIVEFERILIAEPGGTLAELAHAHFQLGLTLGKLGEGNLAIDQYEKACGQQKEVVKVSPGPQADSSLGTYLNNLGLAYKRRGNLTAAEKTLRLAIFHQRRALEGNPQSLGTRQYLSDHLGNLVSVLRAGGKMADAVTITLERQQLWPDQPQQLFDVARDLGYCANYLAEGNKKLLTADQREQDRVADLAVAALRLAVAAGYSDWRAIDEHAAFRVVRTRPGFQHVAKQLRK